MKGSRTLINFQTIPANISRQMIKVISRQCLLITVPTELKSHLHCRHLVSKISSSLVTAILSSNRTALIHPLFRLLVSVEHRRVLSSIMQLAGLFLCLNLYVLFRDIEFGAHIFGKSFRVHFSFKNH